METKQSTNETPKGDFTGKIIRIIIVAIILLFLGILGLSAQKANATPQEKYNSNSDWLIAIRHIQNGKSLTLDDSEWTRLILSHAFNGDEASRLNIANNGKTAILTTESEVNNETNEPITIYFKVNLPILTT